MKLKVVNTDNMTEHLTLSECFMRSIGYIGASFLFYLPFAFNYLRRDQKGMQDFMSGTEVISIDDFAFALAQAEAIPVESAEQISLFEDVA